MTYATGDLIRAADYDRFVIGADAPPPSTTAASAGLVWGTGFGRYGVGQDTSYIHPTLPGDLIRAQEWDNLDAVLRAIIEHQSGPNTYIGPGPAVSGTPIRPLSHLAPYIQTAYNDTGIAFANIDRHINNTAYTGIWGHTGTRALKFVQTFTFSSADDLRYFFNAGGKVKISFNHAGGVASARNAFWDNICAAAGTVVIGYNSTVKIGGTGTLTPGLNTTYGGYGAGGGNGKYMVLGTAGGFWANSAGVSKLHFKQYGTTASYSGHYGGGHYGGGHYGGGDDMSDYISVELKIMGDIGTKGGLGNILEVTTTFENGMAITPAGADQVTGTSTVSAVLSAPDASHLQVQPWNTNTFNGVVSAV